MVVNVSLTRRNSIAEKSKPNLHKFPQTTKKRADFNIEPAFLRLFDIFDLLSKLLKFLVAILGCLAELHLDLHQTVVLGDAVGTAEGTGLDLAAVGSDSDVSDRGVLGLA